MDLLFITHRFPHPPNRGDSIRSFHFLERFSEMGSVHLATLYEQEPSDESQRVLGELCASVLACRWGQNRKWLKAGWALLSGKTMTEGLFFKLRFRHQLRKLFSEKHFDRIVIFCSSMTQYLDARKGTCNEKTPVIVDLVDVDSQKWFDYSARSHGWRKWIFRLEGQRLRRLETRVGTHCAALLAVTPEEIALYESFAGETVKALNPNLRIAAIPNGVDTKFFDASLPELARIPEIPHRLVFVGALDYRANVGGVEWFVENVLPELRNRFEDCEFDVVGSRPTASLCRLAETTPGMNLVGTVPDVRPYLQRASVAVIPLQVARGLQNKVLEACSMTKPVVASVCAAEGIHCETNEDLRICSSPQQWTETISDLFANSDLRARLGQNARKMVELRYGWEPQLTKLENLLKFSSDTQQNRTIEKDR